jgi:ABC-type sugar transport system permease subunit
MDAVSQSGLWSKIKPAKRNRQHQEATIRLLLLAPWLLGLILLKALPILTALIFSVTNFKMLSPETTKFVGLENYLLFFRDPAAVHSRCDNGRVAVFLLYLERDSSLQLVYEYFAESANGLHRHPAQPDVFLQPEMLMVGP